MHYMGDWQSWVHGFLCYRLSISIDFAFGNLVNHWWGTKKTEKERKTSSYFYKKKKQFIKPENYPPQKSKWSSIEKLRHQNDSVRLITAVEKIKLHKFKVQSSGKRSADLFSKTLGNCALNAALVDSWCTVNVCWISIAQLKDDSCCLKGCEGKPGYRSPIHCRILKTTPGQDLNSTLCLLDNRRQVILPLPDSSFVKWGHYIQFADLIGKWIEISSGGMLFRNARHCC